MESARAVVGALKGQAPARTIVFATWDAEEWGLIGSTEYVEDDSLRLLNGAAAYFNMDNGAGAMLPASASGGMRRLPLAISSSASAHAVASPT